MYRPTVRCSDVYKDYIKSLSDVTGLDVNQIIRLALFSAPFSNLFMAQINKHLNDGTPPLPSWEPYELWVWQEQNPNIEEKRGADVNNDESRTGGETPKIVGLDRLTREQEQAKEIIHRTSKGREREVYNKIRINSGGIKFSL